MIVDRALTVRVEQAIVRERSAFAGGMAELYPHTRASSLPVAGGRAIFTGSDFFSNRALGLGVTDPVSPADLQLVEEFYATRDAPSQIEVASTVDRGFVDLLDRRGYRNVRFHNIYAQALTPGHRPSRSGQPAPSVGVEPVVDDAGTSIWSTLLLDGFGYAAAGDRERVSRWNRMLRSLPDLCALVGRLEGTPAGAGSVLTLGDTAVLGGAATLPEHRGRGVQSALVEARLALAAARGCTLAVVTADPGSSSGRNAERAGFRLVGTHLAMRRR